MLAKTGKYSERIWCWEELRCQAQSGIQAESPRRHKTANTCASSMRSGQTHRIVQRLAWHEIKVHLIEIAA